MFKVWSYKHLQNMCENMLTLTGFWIKKKSKDIYVRHTSLVSIVGHWSHSSLLKEYTTDTQGYVGGAKVKNSLLIQWEG